MANRLVASAELDTNLYNSVIEILNYLNTLPDGCYINIKNIANLINIGDVVISIMDYSLVHGNLEYRNPISLIAMDYHAYQMNMASGVLHKQLESSRKEHTIYTTQKIIQFDSARDTRLFAKLMMIYFSEYENKIYLGCSALAVPDLEYPDEN